jgi:hypothetical protein
MSGYCLRNGAWIQKSRGGGTALALALAPAVARSSQYSVQEEGRQRSEYSSCQPSNRAGATVLMVWMQRPQGLIKSAVLVLSLIMDPIQAQKAEEAEQQGPLQPQSTCMFTYSYIRYSMYV